MLFVTCACLLVQGKRDREIQFCATRRTGLEHEMKNETKKRKETSRGYPCGHGFYVGRNSAVVWAVKEKER